MNNKAVIVGLASFGMSGRVFHAPFLERNPNFQLKLILERTKSASAPTYPNAHIVRTFDELLHDDDVELVIINTPSNLHFEMVKQALLAGKHIVVEKPFTSTATEGMELAALAKERNLLLTVYHNRRLDGDFQTIQQLLEQKKIGDLTHAQISFHRFKPEIGPKKWKEEKNPSAGLLYDLGAHLIDQSLMLFGWPQDLEADLQIQRKHGQVIDYFKITLKYPSFEVLLISDMLTKDKKPAFVLKGSDGSFVKYGKDPQEAQLNQEVINWDQLGVEQVENYGLFSSSITGKEERIKTLTGNYKAFYQNLYDVLRHEAPPLVRPDDAIKVIEIIEWAMKVNKST